MKNLSFYVCQTVNESGEKVYFNTLTRQQLPISATFDELESNLFLSGQERESLLKLLIIHDPPKFLNFNIAPTLECNLRCTHCNFSHLLEAKQQKPLNVDKICDFIIRSNVKDICIFFYGGENLLEEEKCHEVIDKIKSHANILHIGMVSNLTIDLNERRLSLIEKLSQLSISLDGGNDLLNDAQRIPLTGNWSPFEKTTNNLKILITKGLRHKINLKASFGDASNTPELRKEYYLFALQFGFKPEQINIGLIGPHSECRKTTKSFADILLKPIFTPTWCCKYRHEVLLTDYTENIFSDYYTYTKIGNLSDSLSTIIERRNDLILKTMPLLNDTKCMKCQAAGYCWGSCAMLDFVGGKSNFCDPVALQHQIQKMANDNKLC
ncbi:MAG: 4Fe-4S cluster-binding domain-containing protein [Proteobacteria bacterium]|jgi:radical SAM protein with 4Fe4S-binding SPASM domain|nr:4Fe-4S cluster-binding domain-containing protein [Pseudomonadota bacterium]